MKNLLLLIVSLIALFLIPLFYLTQSQPLRLTKQHPSVERQALAVKSQTIRPGLPVYLKIPRINVDTGVENVGINGAGEMDIPSNTATVGWYKFGPSPGENGNAVISGHLDNNKGGAGVFDNLHKLKKGDKIYVTTDIGKTVTFVVSKTHTFNPGYADEVFLSNDSGTHLNLITCDGVWNETKKSFSKRLVVFTDIIH